MGPSPPSLPLSAVRTPKLEPSINPLNRSSSTFETTPLIHETSSFLASLPPVPRCWGGDRATHAPLSAGSCFTHRFRAFSTTLRGLPFMALKLLSAKQWRTGGWILGRFRSRATLGIGEGCRWLRPASSSLCTTQVSHDEEDVDDHALERVLADIENDATPSQDIYSTYIDKLCKVGKFSAVSRLLQLLHDRGIFLGQKVYNSLLLMAAERYDIELSSQIFKHLVVSRETLSSASYLNIAKAFARQSDFLPLLRFLKETVELVSSKSTPVVNRLIFSFAKCGQIDKSLLMFDQVKNLKCKPDIITYNTILDVLGRVGRVNQMLHEFSAMKEAGVAPDIVTYNTLINSLRKVGRLDVCLIIFQEMNESGVQPDLLTYTALIECLGRSGNIDQSLSLFHEMKQKQIRPSVYVYRSLISNLKKRGNIDAAMAIFKEMMSSPSELAGPKDFKRNKR